MNSVEAVIEHTASDPQLCAREDLKQLFLNSPLPVDDELFNLFLYARSGLLVKALVMADLYRRILPVPGIIVEAGSWFGQNLVLCENLRAILEPFNKDRRIVSFDTYQGYIDKPGWYSTGLDYKDYLEKLLDAHVRCNVYGHLPSGHELIAGDVCETGPAYFKKNPAAIVAMAYIDMGPEKPTFAILNAIRPHLVPGSVLLMDELTRKDTPGEAIAFKRLFKHGEFTIEKCALYPSKSIVTIK